MAGRGKAGRGKDGVRRGKARRGSVWLGWAGQGEAGKMQQTEIITQLKRIMSAAGLAKRCVRYGGDLLHQLDRIDDAMDRIDDLLEKAKKNDKAA
jgi:hypothetical protein